MGEEKAAPATGAKPPARPPALKRIDDLEDETYLKVGLYGLSGSGKTSYGATMPSPLILLSERQGMKAIRVAAKREGIALPKVVLMREAQAYRDVHRAILMQEASKDPDLVIRNKAGDEVLRFAKFKPQSVVLDSITDAGKLLAEEIQKSTGVRLGKDGLPVLAERYWGVLIDRCEQLIRLYRDVPANVVFLAQMDDRTDEGEEGEAPVRTVAPRMPTRSLQQTLAQATNVLAISRRELAKDATGKRLVDENGQALYRFSAQTAGPGFMLLKTMRPLRDFEPLDFRVWLQRLDGVQPEPDAQAPANVESLGESDDETEAKGG